MPLNQLTNNNERGKKMTAWVIAFYMCVDAECRVIGQEPVRLFRTKDECVATAYDIVSDLRDAGMAIAAGCIVLNFGGSEA